MPYVRLTVQPGIFKDDTPLAAEGYFTDADKIRFERGKPQTIGGQEYASSSAVSGICRNVFTWADNTGNPYAMLGTHLRLYGMNSDGELTDATPVIERGELSSAFSTTLNSISITVRDVSHGLAVDQRVKFANASSTIAGLDIAGTWTVSSIASSDLWTFEHTSSANATVSSGIATVDYEYFLAPGQADGLGGLGYGTGGYGSGGFGSAAAGYVLYARTWSGGNWGQNFLANPRGGGIYEWTPGTSTTEAVTAGDFSSSAAWTAGAGWSVGGGVATATNTTAALSQSVTLPAATWCLLDVDVTRSSGAVAPSWDSSTIGSTISATGTYKRAFFSGRGGARTLAFTGQSNYTGTVDNVSVKPLATATLLSNAPTPVLCSFITTERIVVACGVNDDNGNFQPLRVQWSDQENNNAWTSSASNLAGDFVLSHGSVPVRGLPGNGENLIWTDQALYRMTYVPDPNVVYRFDLVGTGCGLIGPNAAAMVGGAWYWMSPTGEFFAYAGGQVIPLQSTVRRYVFEDLAWVQQDKICAAANSGWSEVWWFYPSQADGTNECTRYVIYDTVDKVWSNGSWDKTAWADASVYQFPISVDSSGGIWFNEKGYEDNGAARSWSIETADMDLGDGEAQTLVNSVKPDAEDLQGGYNMTFTMSHEDVRGKFERTFGPYAITAATGQFNTRAIGQKMRVEWHGSDAPTNWRMGSDRLDVRQVGRRR